jgi:hypothetical protein
MTPDYAANLASFLQEKTGSVCGRWRGRMTASQQRDLFGRFLGKGLLVIDGANERIHMIVKVCFGADFDMREDVSWRDLGSQS